MPKRESIASLAARALLSRPLVRDEVQLTLEEWLGPRKHRLAASAADHLVGVHGDGARPRAKDLTATISGQYRLLRAIRFGGRPAPVPAWPEMIPASGAPATWTPVPLVNLRELAGHLGLTAAGLAWLRAGRRTDHYHRQWIPRSNGRLRLIEAPKPRLAAAQRALLGLVRRIPSHDAAHGFVPGRSPTTMARGHAGQACVLRIDVENFFASIGRGRVGRLLLDAGYPEPVAIALTDLVTTRSPSSAWDRLPRGREATPDPRLLDAHLPQGAPTSPDLANRCFWSMDRRLEGLAQRFGATYSRYADDLVFSGGDDFSRDAKRCAVRVAAILLEGGFAVAHHKTRIMRRGTRQKVTGLVTNDRPTVPRAERERLEAIVHNCWRHGPEGQNRDGHPDFRSHLRGRIARVAALHPRDGARLLERFAAIRWE